ncbi:MAG: metal-dependent hydrolase [Myxococcales bacterium]|jgi:predicted metal-dependent hydrolase|nr:metal-dependent hydrolase [Myxococcales bacterium]
MSDSDFSRASDAPPRVTPRRPKFGFGAVPRHWFGGSAAMTHVVNGVCLLFPAGERFFVRSVRHYEGQIRDPRLAADVRAFYKQEGAHAGAHERFFARLEAQGFDVAKMLETYERLAFEALERRFPPSVRLSVTVALEHFTAIMAENALKDGILDLAHPEMRRLLEWHAAEEIEHKAVAFDVLAEVNPSYALRVFGLLLATASLGAFWVWATRRLLAQDGVDRAAVKRDLARMRKERPIVRRVFLRGIREYLRPGFHPNDTENHDLAAKLIAELEREGRFAREAA